jgi:hypothetical protein
MTTLNNSNPTHRDSATDIVIINDDAIGQKKIGDNQFENRNANRDRESVVFDTKREIKLLLKRDIRLIPLTQPSNNVFSLSLFLYSHSVSRPVTLEQSMLVFSSLPSGFRFPT